MKKGVTGLQNIQLLKWCKEMGIHPIWNFLIGFPRESPDDYFADGGPGDAASATCRGPRASASSGSIASARTSTRPDQLGFTKLRPLPFYEFLYDLPEAARHNLAYYFAYDYKVPQDVARYADPLVKRRARLEDDVAARRAGLGRSRRSPDGVRHAAARRGAGLGADRRRSRAVPDLRRDHRRQRARRRQRRSAEARIAARRPDAERRREVPVARRAGRRLPAVARGDEAAAAAVRARSTPRDRPRVKARFTSVNRQPAGG